MKVKTSAQAIVPNGKTKAPSPRCHGEFLDQIIRLGQRL